MAAAAPAGTAAMPAPGPVAPPMADRLERMRALCDRQLFFVGGAPRSGTTWLQHLLDGHPAVSCMGEGLFWKQLAVPLQAMMQARGAEIAAKNQSLFAHTGGYPLPVQAEVEMLLGAGILSSFDRQLASRPDGGAACRAVGEKTPENVFLFPRLRALFPTARLVAIARDPRDVVASAWHAFCRRVQPEADTPARRMEFIRISMDSMDKGLRAMIALGAEQPSPCHLLTYEALHRDPDGSLGSVFRFLGVPDDRETVAACIARSAFDRLSGGRARGDARPEAFLRQGIVGGWRDTLDGEMNALVLKHLGWSFPFFGWEA